VTARLRVATLLGAALALGACTSTIGPAQPSEPTVASTIPATITVDSRAERLSPVHSLARAPQPAMAPRFQAVLVDDPCVDRDLLAPVASDVTLTVLDRTYALPAGYVPVDLVPATRAGLTGTSGDKLVHAAVVGDLAAMRAAWEAEGRRIELESAYRSFASQAATFNSWVARLGYAGGLVRSARPGHSEHQLGTAIDVTSAGWSERLGDWAVESAEGAWMASHAWEYGFVMSYPGDATGVTCFGYEPWHYRWIGREPAAAHRTSGLPLREFLERYATG